MSREKKFDIAVVGAGPGGYVAAIKAAQKGKKVALIEKKDVGGVCLNVGCIPSKSLLSHSALLKKIQRADKYGIKVEKVSYDYSTIHAHKEQVVQKLRSNLIGLIKSNGIVTFKGRAKFETPKKLKILGEDNLWIHAENIIIATGSEPIDIPAFPCDHQNILNSTSALDLKKLPQSIAIIGGGYIGCEFASLFADFGVKVTIIESLPTIVQGQEKQIATALTTAFKKSGMEIKSNCTVQSIERKNTGVTLTLNGGEKLDVEKVLVSVGRKLNTGELGLEKIGIKEEENGAIAVNNRMETSIKGVYAIGDITAVAMLAHVASHQGIVAATNASGFEAHIHYHAIPSVIFTHPEIASVGLTSEQAQKKGIDFSVGTYPFQALGKSMAALETQGFVQILSQKKTGEILGAHVIGDEASTLIAEMALAKHNELTLDCIMDTIHAHPTLSEAWLEAAFIAKGTPLHFPPKMKRK